MTIADDVVEILAMSEAELLAHVRDQDRVIATLEQDMSIFREAWHVAVHALHTEQTASQSVREQLVQLRHEYRDFRAAVMRQAVTS